MQCALKRFNRWLCLAERAGIQLSAAALFCLMAVIVLDVGCRYLLNTPLPWAFDFITLYLAVALFFFALSDTLRVNGHVAVDIVLRQFPPRARHFALLAGYALACVPFAGMAWLSLLKTLHSYAQQEVMPGVVEFPVWPSSLFATLGLCTFLGRIAFRAADHAHALWTRGDLLDASMEDRILDTE